MAARRVVIVVFEGVQALDLVGPLEVFAAASGEADRRGLRGYDVVVAASDADPLVSASGLTLVPHAPLSDERGHVDTLMVAGGDGTPGALADRLLIHHIGVVARRSRRVTSVCSGSFLLAEAGLLQGRRATTHWSVCDLLADTYPDVTVDPAPIYVRDENVWTSAGVTAGMDLALALVEDDLGRDVALAVARRLVMFLHRPANQAQFSAQLSAQLADRDSIRDAQQWISEHPEADLSVDALAVRSAMSPRHFSRTFRDEVGTTPARYVETVRLEAARRWLEDTTEAVESVASACGFGTAETMRRLFVRSLGINPSEYRRRFRAA